MMTCADCRYCRDRDYAQGVCKRNPPHAIQGFPTVFLHDWCGEWASMQALRVVPPVEEMEQPVEPQPLLAVGHGIEEPQMSWWRRVIG